MSFPCQSQPNLTFPNLPSNVCIGQIMHYCHFGLQGHRYSEAADCFYSSNNFTTIITDNIEFLPRLLPIHRIDSIRSLRFVWPMGACSPPRPPSPGTPKGLEFRNNVWVTIWTNLASMKGLRELRVKLQTKPRSWEGMRPDAAVSLLDPVMRVTTPEFFELAVPFSCEGENEWPWRSLPCRIQQYEYVYTRDPPKCRPKHRR